MVNKCHDGTHNYITYGQMNILNDFRKLWTELSIWMKAFIISTDHNSDDLAVVSERLYRIPKDFYFKIEMFFGSAQSEQFVTLLTNHIVIGMRLATALKNSNRQAIDENADRWYKNANEISDFLAQTNVFWNKGQWYNLFFQYISMTIEAMLARFSTDYVRQVLVNDRIINHVLIMADYMSTGIMQHVMVSESLNINKR